MQAPPQEAGIALADWNWKVVQEFIVQRFGQRPCRSSCLNYLHRLGFVLKRPKKRLLKADAQQREAFIAFYAALCAEAQAQGAKILFVDEAHFRADADLRGKWVLRGQPALVDSSSPSLSQKVNYYSAVCLETGEVETMEVSDQYTAETSAAFLRQLRARWKGERGAGGRCGPSGRAQASKKKHRDGCGTRQPAPQGRDGAARPQRARQLDKRLLTEEGVHAIIGLFRN